MSKMRKILVPTDFSENASSVFNLVKKIAESYNAKVDLIHIIPDSRYPRVVKKGKENTQEVARKSDEFKEELTKRLESEMIKYLPEPIRGKAYLNYAVKPTRGIIAHSNKEQYDLLMIASRGMGDSSYIRGSATEKIIRLSNVPVFSINRNFDLEIDSILVPTDGSAVSLEALPLALLVAAQNDATINLLSISKFDRTKINWLGDNSSFYAYIVQQIKKTILERLTTFVEDEKNKVSFEGTPTQEEVTLKTKYNKSIKLRILIKNGMSTYLSIIEYAEANSDLVVMTTQGRSAVTRFLIGSNTEKIVRYLKMPILTVKPEFAKKQ